MPFYQDISKYYDYVFPTGKEQLGFIREAAGNPPKALLDIACGTGGYSMALAEAGYEVTASDIDPSMLEGLKKKLKDGNIEVKGIEAGMLELAEKVDKKFDLAFCIGNSVVHLGSMAEIQQFFNSAGNVLKKDGVFIIQIINFDRVLSKHVTELPTITNDEAGLTFERYYRHDPSLNRIYFRTILTAGEGKIENEIPLFPLLSDDAVRTLENAGFGDISLFGDFKGSPYDSENSFMLVIKAYNYK